MLALVLACSLPASAAPDIRLVEAHKVGLRIRALTALPSGSQGDGSGRLDVDPDHGGELTLNLDWPEPGSRTRVRLRAMERPPPPGQDHAIQIEADLTLPDGARRHSTRSLSFVDSTTALFEVARVGERPLALAIEAECTREPQLSAQPVSGRPVVMRLEIQRLQAGQSVLLETNHLSTFVAEPVFYSFHLGGPAEASLRVQLTPLRLFDDVAQIEVEVSGAIPDGDGLAVISRKEHWVASRGATSSLTVAAGQPPVGYRFLVTPDF